MRFATKSTRGTGQYLDSRAVYGIYDTEKHDFTLRRVDYDMEKAVQRIVDAGIPEENARRLREGG